jgi:hypothetical protein
VILIAILVLLLNGGSVSGAHVAVNTADDAVIEFQSGWFCQPDTDADPDDPCYVWVTREDDGTIIIETGP